MVRNRTLSGKKPSQAFKRFGLTVVGTAILILVVAGIAFLTSQGDSQVPLNPGDEAPPFSLVDANGQGVTLEGVLSAHQETVLVFYRGHF